MCRLVRDADLEADAAAFVEDYSRNSLPYIFDANVAAWKYNTNLTDENLQAQVIVELIRHIYIILLYYPKYKPISA